MKLLHGNARKFSFALIKAVFFENSTNVIESHQLTNKSNNVIIKMHRANQCKYSQHHGFQEGGLFMKKVVSGAEIDQWVDRNLYNDLVEWKNDFTYSKRGVFLRGSRQVGKTTLLNYFGETQFKKVVYINLRPDAGAEFETIIMEHYKAWWSNGSRYPSDFAIKAYSDFGFDYRNDPETLVIWDEIQERPKMYSLIRDVVRGLKSKFIVTGSYLGDFIHNRDLSYPSYDLHELQLTSISFPEFLDLTDFKDEYMKIESFNKSELSNPEIEVFEKVRAFYKSYLFVGGYPDVVKNLAVTGDYASCVRIADNYVLDFYDECFRRNITVVDINTWNWAFRLAARALVRRAKYVDILKEKRNLFDTAQKVRYTEEKISEAVNWLVLSGLLYSVDSTSDLTGNVVNTTFKYYFSDLGFLNYYIRQNQEDMSITGHLAENFVFLALFRIKKLFRFGIQNYYKATKALQEEIDFVVRTYRDVKIGIEVKYGSGPAKSGKKALEDGRIDYLIKIQDTFGSIDERMAVLPIFAIDRLESLILLIDEKYAQ
jgi:predicted AAA+ superfamily ATPase